tara:strand:- start:778 stop:963 length:186 start_codon:yes stop_codon:yes gene_type:complete
VRVGDLISFKPIGFGTDDWSNPSIVLKQYESPDDDLFIVWVDGMTAIIDNDNYEIAFLTST